MDSHDIAGIVEDYVAVRDIKREMEARHAAELKQVDDVLEAAKRILTQYMLNNKQTGIKTERATINLVTNAKVDIRNRAEFVNWVRQTGEVDMLEIRAAKTNVLKYAEEHGNVPPGLKKEVEYVVRVTASRG